MGGLIYFPQINSAEEYLVDEVRIMSGKNYEGCKERLNFIEENRPIKNNDGGDMSSKFYADNLIIKTDCSKIKYFLEDLHVTPYFFENRLSNTENTMLITLSVADDESKINEHVTVQVLLTILPLSTKFIL